ncbi:MAG: hypothetical protein WBJ13_06665 [Sedimentibacter sp.]
MTDKYVELEKEKVPYDQLHDLVIGTSKKAPVDGDVEWGLVQAGQSLSVIKSIESCEILKFQRSTFRRFQSTAKNML